jgi:hypothetical protein
LCATTLPGTPLLCANDEYVRRNVNQLHCGMPSAAHAGSTCRFRMLFGKMGFPDRVENTSASSSVTFAIAFQSAMHPTAAFESGIVRAPLATNVA